MKTVSEKIWQQLPAPTLPAPIFALAVERDGIWAGSIGGLARYSEEQGAWESGAATLPLSSVTALLALDGLLLAGGSEGIASSVNGGKTWRQAKLEDGSVSVVALVASPDFAHDQTALAATLEHGVVRTNDGGENWTNASFGLESLEVNALLWGKHALLLAAKDGIYRSRDAGRGWRRVSMDAEVEIEAMAALADGTLLAALADGNFLHSHDDGQHWSSGPDLARHGEVLSLWTTPAGTLLCGTFGRGLLRSSDAGASWQTVYERLVHVCVRSEGNIYVGTELGVSVSSDDGLTWRELPCPPLHDLRHLLARDEHLLLLGTYSGVMHSTPEGWKSLNNIPEPLTAFALAPDNALFLSGPEGLNRLSLTDGATQSLLAGQMGQVAHITRRHSHIWAAGADGRHLLHSANSGANWQQVPAPFGVLPLVALRAMADRLLAATYDPRQYQVCLWHSTDDGETWARGVEARTNWPVVAICPRPAALSIGNILFLEQEAGQWQQVTVGSDGGAIRRVLSVRLAGKSVLFVLTTTGVQWSENMGETWQQENVGLPVEQIVDMAVTCATLSVLLTGGRVWQCDLQELRLAAAISSGPRDEF